MSSPFNLDQALADWRRQMAAEGMNASEVLDEPESHLRQEFERQMKCGINPPLAFGMAVGNLGQAAALKNEFKKIRQRSSVTEKLMIGICGVFVGFIMLLSALTIFICFARWGDRATAAGAVGGILLVACGWGRGVPFLPVIADTRLRWAAGLTCIAGAFIVPPLICNYVLPHCEAGPDHQLPAIGLWAVFLLAVFACTGLGLLMSERQRAIWGMDNSSICRSAPRNS